MPEGKLVGGDAQKPPFVAVGALAFRSGKLKRGERLFSSKVDGDGVNDATAPDIIRKAFENVEQGALSDAATIEKMPQSRSEWLIVDGSRTFIGQFIVKRDRLEVFDTYRNRTAASGVIVGPRHILTATHNFSGDWGECRFTPGFDEPPPYPETQPGSQSPPAAWPPVEVEVPPKGLNNDSQHDNALWHGIEEDAGLLSLEEDLPPELMARIGDSVKIADPATLTPRVGMTVYGVGYPAEKNGRMWVSRGEIVHVADGLFFFTHEDLTVGASGGPIWVLDEEGRARIIGVLSKTLDTPLELDRTTAALLQRHPDLAAAAHIGPDVYRLLPPEVRNR